jgi:hypothetical protein
MQMRDELGTIYDDEQFASVYAEVGQPAIVPWRLALVSVMQFAENLSDRQAAEAVRARIDWKYALSLPLNESGGNEPIPRMCVAGSQSPQFPRTGWGNSAACSQCACNCRARMAETAGQARMV